jgi:hypothetical protein
MRQKLIETMKTEIEAILTAYLQQAGIDAADDKLGNLQAALEGIEDIPLEGTLLQWEIRVILGLMGKSWQSDALVEELYRALAAYKPTAQELTTLLMSLHVEVLHSCKREVRTRAMIRYIVGQD